MEPDHAAVLTRRNALRAFVVSIVVSALLGIWALLSGDFDELQIKVLLSSLCVSGATLCALSSAALLEARGERTLPYPGLALAALGLVLVLTGMWGEIESEAYWKLTASTCFFAAAFAHGSLVRMAHVAPRHVWVVHATVGAALVLAAFGAGLVLGEVDGEAAFRLLGVLSILVAAGSLATPVVHRLDRDAGAADEGDGPAAGVAMLCPACGQRFRNALGDVTCPRCDARFSIRLRNGA